MSNLQEIEQAVSQLSSIELIAFRNWFEVELWDRQLAKDVAAGRLNKLAEQAREHLRAGRCTDL